jgi:hypothetical protein
MNEGCQNNLQILIVQSGHSITGLRIHNEETTMSSKEQDTSEKMREKMERRYGDEVEHKHDKDHMEYREHEKSHPHTQHGGDPSGHKHLVQQHHRHESDKGTHDRPKKHDHKEHTREHHKTSKK